MNIQPQVNSQTWNFQNSYVELPAKLYMKQLPVSVQNPQIIYYNGSEFCFTDSVHNVISAVGGVRADTGWDCYSP